MKFGREFPAAVFPPPPPPSLTSPKSESLKESPPTILFNRHCCGRWEPIADRRCRREWIARESCLIAARNLRPDQLPEEFLINSQASHRICPNIYIYIYIHIYINNWYNMYMYKYRNKNVLKKSLPRISTNLPRNSVALFKSLVSIHLATCCCCGGGQKREREFFLNYEVPFFFFLLSFFLSFFLIWSRDVQWIEWFECLGRLLIIQ